MLIAFIIVFIHFIADFIFQDERRAVGKSKRVVLLLKHTATYSLIWLVVIFFLVCTNILSIEFLWFVPITFIAHTITDFFTSKATSSLYAQKKFGSPIPNLGFFTVIGFDQVLHYAQLFFTYCILNT